MSKLLILIIFFGCFPVSAAFSDEIVTSRSGKAVHLMDDWTWEYVANSAKKPQTVIENVNIADFVDNTQKYKGRTLKIQLGYKDSLNLRDGQGNELEFYNFKGANLKMFILIPKNISVPNARFMDQLYVTFICKHGRLDSGNVATLITRAE